MTTAEVIKTDDLGYKAGFVECSCGWKQELGDGFNGYHIANCPSCTLDLTTRIQRKVVYNDKWHSGLTADIGANHYFAMSNGINVRYYTSKIVSHYGLTEKQADKL